MRLAAVSVLLGISVVGAPLHAQPAPGASADDPYETSNRRFYSTQNGIDQAVFLPLARLYHALTPGLIGLGIHNVLQNLSEPVVIINDLLQGRLKRAGHETLRLTANTTAGWLGLMDVATPAGLARQDTDFGITLGRWGVRPGPYLYLPLIGPTTPRDLVGLGADTAMNPLNFISYPDRIAVAVSTTVAGGLDLRVRSQEQLDALLGDAADPYATLRSVYLQSREAAVEEQDGAPALTPLDEPPVGDMPPSSPAPSETAPPAAETPTPPEAVSPVTPAVPASAPAASVDNPNRDVPVATARDWRPTLAAGAPSGPAA